MNNPDDTVTLEFPLGEIARGDTTSTILAMMVRQKGAKPQPLTGKERFSAQGLEGKLSLELPRQVAETLKKQLPAHRSRIVETQRRARS